MKDISMPILIVSAVIVALASSITALTVNPTGNVMGYYSLQAAGTQIFYDEFNDLSAWTGNINSTMWHTTSSGYNSLTSAFKDAYGSHYISHTQSTVGYSNITISFAALNKLKDAGESFRMDWYDGVWWTSTGSLPRNSTWTYYSYNLPASAANNPNFAVKFICYDWHTYDAADWCQVDAVKITGVAATQTCSDGTPYTQCSVTKPKYCANGTLINNCAACGCPTGQNCNQTSNGCYVPANPQTCADGTPYGQCSVTKPMYCDNGNLVARCTTCGCPTNSTCNSTTNLCSPAAPPGGGGGAGVKLIKYEERILLGQSGGIFSRYDESSSNLTGHGLYLSAPYSTGAIEFRLHFTDPLPVGSSISLTELPQINLLNWSTYVDYKTAMNGSLPIYAGNKVTMLVGDETTTADGYKVRLNTVILDGTTFYATYTATSPTGTTETSIQLKAGQSYSFFGNNLAVYVNQAGYDPAVARGWATTIVANGRRLLTDNAAFPLDSGWTVKHVDVSPLAANMAVGDEMTTIDGYKVKLDTVVLTNGVYYAIYSVTNSAGTKETSTYLTNGNSYYFFDNKVGVFVHKVSYNNATARNEALTQIIPKDKYQTLNYIALKYGSMTSPPNFDGTVQNGLAQGVWINGPKQADNTAKFRLRLKGLGSTSQIIDTTNLNVVSSGSSGANITATHVLKPTWTARDGRTQTLGASAPNQIVIPETGSQASFTASDARWMVVNDKVVYLKEVVPIVTTPGGYNVKLAIGGSAGTEVVVGPFNNASGASATLFYNSTVNSIMCKVILGSPDTVSLMNVTLIGSGRMSVNDSRTPLCDVYPDTVTLGNAVTVSNEPFMDLRFIQGKDSGPLAVNIMIDGVVKHWPLLTVGSYESFGSSRMESATVVYDSEAGSDGLTGLKIYKDLSGTLDPNGLVINTTGKYLWVDWAKSPLFESDKYDTTVFSAAISVPIKNLAVLVMPEAKRSALVEITKSGQNSSYPVELSPIYASNLNHYMTSTRSFIITPSVLTFLYKFTTNVTSA